MNTWERCFISSYGDSGCCTLRNQFPGCGEIVLKALMIIVCCHLIVTLLFVVFLNEGPGKLGL